MAILGGGIVGVLVGTVVGLALGGYQVWLQRYLGFGLHGLAFEVLGRAALSGLLGGALLGGVAGAALSRLARFDEALARVARQRWRPAIAAAAVALLLYGIHVGASLVADRSGPNVLLITVDTLRADHLGAYGYARDTSPNLDRLARESVRFDQGIAQWPKTSPSFASMLTSTYGWRNGLMRKTHQAISPRLVLLGEVMKNAHYRTVGIVTNTNLGSQFEFDQGFDEYWPMWLENRYTRGLSREDRRRARYVSDVAIDWLEQKGGTGKFFLWLHYLDPHSLYDPPAPYHEMFVGDASYQEGWFLQTNEPRNYIGGLAENVLLGDRRDAAYYVAQYDAEIRYADHHIGRVLEALRRLGLDENTIIVFTSDHGESLTEHQLFFNHGRFPYDACSRVPLTIRVPGSEPPLRVVEEPAELLHLMPTILDLAGVPAHPEAQGVSLEPLLLRGEPVLPRYAFTEAGYRQDYQRSIRDRNWKLIYVPDERDRSELQGSLFELYDIREDPNETRNRVASEPEVVARLAPALFEWMEAAGSDPIRFVADEVELDAETIENLRSLGYIE